MTVTVNANSVQINSATITGPDDIDFLGTGTSDDRSAVPETHFEDYPYPFAILDSFLEGNNVDTIRVIGYEAPLVASGLKGLLQYFFRINLVSVSGHNLASSIGLSSYRNYLTTNVTSVVFYCPGPDITPQSVVVDIKNVISDGTPVILCSSVFGGPNQARDLRAAAAALRIPFADVHDDAVSCMSETFNWGKIFDPSTDTYTTKGSLFVAGSIFRHIVPCYRVDGDNLVPFVRGQYTFLSPSNGVATNSDNPFKYAQQITKGTGNYITFAVWSTLDRPKIKCVMQHAANGGVMNLFMYNEGASSVSSEDASYGASTQDLTYDPMAGLHVFLFQDASFVGGTDGTTRIWPVALEYVSRPVPNSKGEYIYIGGTGTHTIANNGPLSWTQTVKSNGMTLSSSQWVFLDPANVYVTVGRIAVVNADYVRFSIKDKDTNRDYSGEIIPRGSNTSSFAEDASLGSFHYVIEPVHNESSVLVRTGSQQTPSGTGLPSFDRLWSHWIIYSI